MKHCLIFRRVEIESGYSKKTKAFCLYFSKLCYIPNISLNNPWNRLCWLLAVSFMCTLRKNSPSKEFFLICILVFDGGVLRKFLYSVRISKNTDQRKLRSWTPFTQCYFVLVKNAQCTFTPLKPIPVTKLKEYVAQNRQNKDRGFIEEFRVSPWSSSIGSL